MSIHKSLRPKDKLKRQRNVLTRRERVKKLVENGQFDEEEDSVFGLPKLKKSRSSPVTGVTDEGDAGTDQAESEASDAEADRNPATEDEEN